jgi:hypothetical protein
MRHAELARKLTGVPRLQSSINTGSAVATALLGTPKHLAEAAVAVCATDNAPTCLRAATARPAEPTGYGTYVIARSCEIILENRLRLRRRENFLETRIASQAIPPPAPQLCKRNWRQPHAFRRRRSEQLFHQSDGLFCFARQRIHEREIS